MCTAPLALNSSVSLMSMKESIDFEAIVVCEYTRHWDTHTINEKAGELTDAVLQEIAEADRKIHYGYGSDFAFAFGFSHFTEDAAPAWFRDVFSVNRENVYSPFKIGFLTLESTATVTKQQYRQALRNSDGSPITEGEFSDDQLLHVYKDFVVSTLSDYAFLFSLAANIAKPGSFQFKKRHLFQNRSLIRTVGGTMNSFDHAVEISKKYAWPPISPLSVYRVWDWLLEIPGFTLGESKSTLGRAVGALSYLLHEDYKDGNDLALVWALIGLEALYGKGNVSLKSQLMEKTEAFLGPRTAFKREFGNMYDFRSRLVHGDKNFNFKGFESNTDSDFSKKMMDSEDFAVTSLISTLQRMCSLGLRELKFRVNVE
jgi:hypothetical protein